MLEKKLSTIRVQRKGWCYAYRTSFILQFKSSYALKMLVGSVGGEVGGYGRVVVKLIRREAERLAITTTWNSRSEKSRIRAPATNT